MESRDELDHCCAVLGANEKTVCRLVARDETLRVRITQREQGVLQREFIERITTLNGILDAANVEDFSVSTEHRNVTEVAHEVLLQSRWISA